MPTTRFPAWMLRGLILFLFATGEAHAQLINGGFQTGDFTGWTVTNTPNGRTVAGAVVAFDTAGTGTPSLSAKFEVGKLVATVGDAGMDIYQVVSVGAGPLSITMDIASSSASVNADGGTFELLLNGTEVASHDFGGMTVDQTKRATLDYSGNVAAGNYDIEILMLRNFLPGTLDQPSPFQYLDNVQLTAAPVREATSTAWLLGLSVTSLIILAQRKSARA